MEAFVFSMPRLPFGELRFLYVGSADVGRDLKYYVDALGSKKVWDRTAFGTRVAAVRVAEGPLILLAGHRSAPSCLPIFDVDDIEATARELKRHGWHPESDRFEIPNGPCYLFKDPSGNQLAIFQDVRPDVFGRETG